MSDTFFVVVFWLLLIDAIGAVIVSWSGWRQWYLGNCTVTSRLFPPSKGWASLYLILILFIGYILTNFGVTLL